MNVKFSSALAKLLGVLPTRALVLMVEVAESIGLIGRSRALTILNFGFHGIIQSGPFMGMRYIRTGFGPSTIPKTLGTYELELIAPISQLKELRFDLLVNIGTAEGYYLVGLLRANPNVKGVGFEIDPVARRMCSKIARMNRVESRVVLMGECTSQSLAKSLETACFPIVVCDCEGAEEELLDPLAVPGLLRATLLCEVHEFDGRPRGEILKSRFRLSHVISEYRQIPRALGHIPPTCRWPDSYAIQALDEGRPKAIHWLFMRPRSPDMKQTDYR